MATTAPITDTVGYRPLKPGQIRLVALTRDKPGDPLRANTLFTVGLTPTATEYGSVAESLEGTKRFLYGALSYTWGAHNTKVPLELIDGDTGTSFSIKVTINTVKAIEQKSSHWPGLTCPIWIDQICINQDSELEKSEQVAMMKDIYECAIAVYVWLGDPGLHGNLAFRAIERWWKLRQAREAKTSDISSSTTSAPENQLSELSRPHRVRTNTRSGYPMGMAGLSTDDMYSRLVEDADELFRLLAKDGPRAWEAVVDLARRPWFRRAWIRQEVTAIPDKYVLLYSGTSVMKWNWVRDFLIVARMVDARGVPEGFPSLEVFRDKPVAGIVMFDGMRQMAAPLIMLLREIRWAEASDVRDLLYSVVGCASDVSAADALLRPDYSESKEGVFLNFVIWYIKTHRNLDFLGDARPMKHYVLRWVPRWDDGIGDPGHLVLREASALMSKSARGSSLYHASGPVMDSLEVVSYPSSQPTSLGLDGVRIARIRWVPDIYPPGRQAPTRGDETIAPVRQWRHQVENRRCPLNEIPLHDVFARTIVRDVERIKAGDRYTWSRNASLDVGSVPSRSQASSLSSAVRGRSIFSTGAIDGDGDEEGLLGLGPSWMVPGDEIFMFKGGSVLYVLREYMATDSYSAPCLDCNGQESNMIHATAGDSFYCYVGECFMHGLMDGEILDMIGSDRKRETPAALAGMDDDFKKYYIY